MEFVTPRISSEINSNEKKNIVVIRMFYDDWFDDQCANQKGASTTTASCTH